MSLPFREHAPKDDTITTQACPQNTLNTPIASLDYHATTSLLIHIILFTAYMTFSTCITLTFISRRKYYPIHSHPLFLMLFGESLKYTLVIISFLQNINRTLISESLMHIANYYIYPMYFYSVIFMRAINVRSEWQWQAGMAEVHPVVRLFPKKRSILLGKEGRKGNEEHQ